MNDEGVLLKKADGDTKLVPLGKLSVRDRRYAKAERIWGRCVTPVMLKRRGMIGRLNDAGGKKQNNASVLLVE